jgi:uncharacterized protein YjbI with pentapeptide repeats
MDDERRLRLQKDWDHGGKITANSRNEDEIGEDLEARGILPGVDRPEGVRRRGDLVSGNGRWWDVKGPQSREAVEGLVRAKAREKGLPEPTFDSETPLRGQFDIETEMDKIRKTIAKDRGIILDMRGLDDGDLHTLKGSSTKGLLAVSSGTPESQFPGRGPFMAPPPEVLRQLEVARTKDVLAESDAIAFPQMDLAGIDLGGEYLADGILYETNLSGARLDGAVARRAFAGGVVLRNASCCGTDFYKAELQGADFTGVLGHGIHLARADLTEARFDDGDFWHGDFSDAFCNRASFVGADLSLCNFRDASLSGADLSHAQFGWADLTGAFLDSETRLDGAVGVEHTATLIRFEGEVIEGPPVKALLAKLAHPATSD